MSIVPNIIAQPRTRFTILAAVFCLANFIFWLWMCFPGVLYGDNAMMLAESLMPGGIGDQHSVMYTWLLKTCHGLFGPGIAYPLIWGLLFWMTGVFCFTLGLYVLYRNYWALLFAAFFSDLPIISFVFPHLQLKDMSMSAAFFAACGLLFLLVVDNRKRSVLILACLLSFLAITFRHNAIFAFVPLSVCMALQSKPDLRTFAGYLKLTVMSGAITIVMFGAKVMFDRAARDYENYFVSGCLFSFDLAGMSVNTGEMLIPEERLMKDVTIRDLDRVFNPAGWDPLWGGWGSPIRILNGEEDQDGVRRLRAQWASSVRHHFGAYIKHRAAHFRKFNDAHNDYLSIGAWPANEAWQRVNSMILPDYRAVMDRIPVASFQMRHDSSLERMARRNVALSRQKAGYSYMIFTSYVLDCLNSAIVLSLILVAACWLRPRWFSTSQRKLILFAGTLYVSGWIYYYSYFFVSVSSDWRYIHWSSLSFWIGTVLLFSALLEKLPVSRLTHVISRPRHA